ncbi:MAG: hypothetical protein IMZ61_08975 [Planctomycetes bacterium]|nr:hypothetical protein [Planctomycetota bacterium]
MWNDIPEYLPPTFENCLTIALEHYEGRLCNAVYQDPAAALALLGKWRPEANLQAVKFFQLIDSNMESITHGGNSEAGTIILNLILDNNLFFDWAGWQLEFKPGVPFVKQAADWFYKARALRAARLGIRILQGDPELLDQVYRYRHV